MSNYAKILSLAYDSAAATKTSALKTRFRSVRLIKSSSNTDPQKPSYETNVLLNGNCVDAETRNLYVFYIDTYFGSAWIIEINIDTRRQTVVYFDRNNDIGFSSKYKFQNAKVVHGRLIWTDNNNPIYQMDIERAKKSFYYKIGYEPYPDTSEWISSRAYLAGEIVSAGNYFYKAKVGNHGLNPQTNDSVTWQTLCMIEDAYYSMKIENFYFEPMPPKHPPVLTYKSDNTRKINNLRQTLFQAAYRYVYMDWRKSTFSPASIVPVPQAEEATATGLASEQISLNNMIEISVNLGGEEVRAVEIIGRSSQDISKWFLIDTINKFEQQEKGDQISKISYATRPTIKLSVKPPTVRNINGPADPVATAATNLTSTSFYANWGVATGATGYYLDVATDAAFTTYVSGYHNRDVADVTTFMVRGLDSNKTYYYRVRAYNDHALVSHNSNVITVVIVLSAPIALPSINITGTTFTANWASVEGATGYKIDVARDIAFADFVVGYQDLDVANVLTRNIIGLVADTSYYVRVRAYNSLGDSASSNIVSTRTEVPPANPVAIAASSITTESLNANWNASVGATGYYLDVATDVAFANMIEGFNNRYVGNVLTCVVRVLSSNTNYYYRVKAVNSHDIQSGYSNIITTKTLIMPCQTLPATSIFGTGFTANWTAIAGATGYRLDVATDINFTAFVAGYQNKDVGNVLTSNVVGLALNTTYFFRVRVYDAVQTSASSDVASLRTGTPPSDIVALPASNILLDGFTANWQASLGAAGYYLDIATDPLFVSKVTGYNGRDVGNVTSFNIRSLLSSTNYYYRLRAYDVHGLLSAYSNVVSVKTLIAPPVMLISTGIFGTGFTANWSAVAGVTGYYFDIATDALFVNKITGYNNLNVGSVTFKDVVGLALNTSYYIRVRAYNSDGASANSNVIATRTLEGPSIPVPFAATNIVPTGFTANWNASTNVSGYYLDVSTDINFGSFISGYNARDIGNVLSFLVRGLASATTHYYRLRAYDSHGLVSGYSSVISALTLPAIVPDPPVATAATNKLSTSFSANWNASALAIGYRLDISTSPVFASFISGYNGKDVGNVLTFPVTGLLANTRYYYRVRAYSADGSSANSNSITALTPAPPSLFISLSVSNWNFGGSGTGFKKVITVSTNGDNWYVTWPSANNRILEYTHDANSITLYYNGSIATADTVVFTARRGVLEQISVTFTGRWV